MAEDIPSIALAVLRIVRGWSQAMLAKEAGVRPATASDWERGRKTLSSRTLERLAALMGYSPGTVQRTVAFIQEARLDAGPASPGDACRQLNALAEEYGREMTDFLRAGFGRLMARLSAVEARSQAPFLWERLRRYRAGERRAVVEQTEEFWSWALCELLCEESVKAARDKPERALALSELALLIAGRVAGDERWRQCLQGYTWAFLGNARRVSGDLPGADEAFSRSAGLWQAGGADDRRILDESRLLDLEASLRRDQRRLPEALKLLDRALTLGKAEAAGRILIKKAKTLEELDDYEGAVAALRQAEPLVDKEADPWLFLSLRFNLLENLFQVGRLEEAAPMFPGVRELAARLRNELDLVRLRWLEGRIAAGLGRPDEAAAALRQVRADFASRGIAYDTALVTLELSVLLAEQGRTGEVKDLARNLAPLFRAQGVHREALAALAVFRKAAEEETLTAALVREILAFLQKARRDPKLRFADFSPSRANRSDVLPR